MENKLHILGSSSAIPTKNRFTAAQALLFNQKLFLIDCGEGTQVRLRQLKLRMQKINHVFISHLHGDHYLGLMGLISSLNLLGREHDLHIYTFPALKEIIEKQVSITGMHLAFALHFHNLIHDKKRLIFEDNQQWVYSFPLNHRIETCGFLFKEKQALPNIRKDFVAKEEIPIEMFNKIKQGSDFVNKDGKLYKHKDITTPPPPPSSFAYCSDTVYDEKIIQYIEGTELLFHESTFTEEMKQTAKEKMHSTAFQAGTIAKKANVSKLVIGHFSARYKELDTFLYEAKKVFPNTTLANDLGIITF